MAALLRTRSRVVSTSGTGDDQTLTEMPAQTGRISRKSSTVHASSAPEILDDPRGKVSNTRRLLAAIEAGGTKMVLGIGTAEGSLASTAVPTREPEETISAIAAFFDEAAAKYGAVEAVGIASFGPLDLERTSSTFGHIMPTSKLAWSGVDLLGRVRAALGGVPGTIDTDVNAAALAEARFLPGGDLAYVTIGTGIGVGLVINGKPVHGAAHPEGGHILVRRHPAHDGFPGICPFHQDCLEGLASGPAVIAAWGGSLADLPADHVAWNAEADYLAQLAVTLILSVCPARIVFGGGVMQQQRLLGAVRDRAAVLLGGYLQGADRAALETRIVAPQSVEPPGLIGAYLLAVD